MVRHSAQYQHQVALAVAVESHWVTLQAAQVTQVLILQ
jgi:hypothetical protein